MKSKLIPVRGSVKRLPLNRKILLLRKRDMIAVNGLLLPHGQMVPMSKAIGGPSRGVLGSVHW